MKNSILGFEVECIVQDKFFDTFCHKVKKLNPKIKIGEDCSIEPEEYEETCEIKTPPLPFRKSVSILRKIFALLDKYGRTNYSCGFHVNLSYKGWHDKPLKFKLKKFLNNKIWDSILVKYDRDNNDYCNTHNKIQKDIIHITNDADLKEEMEDLPFDKYYNVSLRNLERKDIYKRIEIRGFGNINYHRRLKELQSQIKQIIKLFENSVLKA